MAGFSSLCWPLKNYFEYFKENGSPGPNKTLEHAMAMAMVTKSESSKPESEGGGQRGKKGGGEDLISGQTEVVHTGFLG